MSDFPDLAPDTLPDSSGTKAGVGGSSAPGSVQTGSLAVYRFLFQPPDTLFNVGDEVNLQWLITDLHGNNVPVPTTGKVLVQDTGGNSVGEVDMLYCAQTVPSLVIEMNAVFVMSTGGAFNAVLQVELDAAGSLPRQVRSSKQFFRVQA